MPLELGLLARTDAPLAIVKKGGQLWPNLFSNPSIVKVDISAKMVKGAFDMVNWQIFRYRWLKRARLNSYLHHGQNQGKNFEQFSQFLAIVLSPNRKKTECVEKYDPGQKCGGTEKVKNKTEVVTKKCFCF